MAMDKIVEWAQIAVNFADQIYKNGQIKKEQRKDEAMCFLNMAILSSGMEITPEIRKLMDGSIEACVCSNKHKKDHPAKAAPEESQDDLPV
jgi:hypothetical protein